MIDVMILNFRELKLKEKIVYTLLKVSIKKQKSKKKKRTLIDYLERKEVAYKNNKIKSIIDFDDSQARSIKSLAIEVKKNVTVTTRFMKGKMLMFAKTSLQEFVYGMIYVFMYPDEVVQTVYANCQVKTCKLYQNLTDTDSTSLTFIFIFGHDCKISEKDSGKVIFDVLVVSKIINRLDLSDDFWAQLGVQNNKLKKQVWLYEIESIDNPNILTVSINPEEYFKK